MSKRLCPLALVFVIVACSESLPPPGDAKQEKAQQGAHTPRAFEAKSATPVADRLAAFHILIAYKGAQRARPTVTRTKAEALALATRLATELGSLDSKAPATRARFEALAKQHSDCPSASRGGNLGAWRRGRMAPAFDAGTLALSFGEVSKVVSTPFGFHIIRRVEPPVEYAASHILIAYTGAKRAKVQRTRAQALALATKLATELQADTSRFFKAAQINSDGPSGPRGGKLGIFPKGRMAPAFEAAVAKLKIGQVSDPVETQWGFHIILREKP